MVAIAYSVAFEGIEARLVEVQCSVAAGLPGFAIVGLPDKAVSEARERVKAAFGALSIAMPNRRLTVNLSPADLPKEGSHFDLPIALAILAALEIIPGEELSRCVALGELALDGGDIRREAEFRDRVLMQAAPFTGEPVKLIDLKVLDYVGSDHFPMLIELSSQPHTAPKQAEAPITPIAMPPGLRPNSALAASNRSRAKPPRSASAPIRMNSGMTERV